METVKIAELLARPQVLSEMAKSLKDGTCEVKIEGGQIVIFQVRKTVKYKD